jgi:hypothetical protein
MLSDPRVAVDYCQPIARGTALNDQALTHHQQLELEITNYLAIPDNTSTGLKWWKQHKSEYPLLAQVARFYLVICSTESECERMGSSCANIVSERRTRLKPYHVHQMMFLKTNDVVLSKMRRNSQ